MVTQGGTNASNSIKLTTTINQNKTNFTYDTEKKSYFWLTWLLSITLRRFHFYFQMYSHIYHEIHFAANLDFLFEWSSWTAPQHMPFLYVLGFFCSSKNCISSLSITYRRVLHHIQFKRQNLAEREHASEMREIISAMREIISAMREIISAMRESVRKDAEVWDSRKMRESWQVCSI